MTVSVNSLLNTGKGALMSFQSAIHVTGENIANVNTPGYNRRSVHLEEKPSLDFRPGQIGTGVTAREVIRHYDYFIERQFLDKSSTMNRWDALQANLRQVETLFNESIGDGLNDVLARFWADWQNVSLRPGDITSRGQLMNTAQNMTNIFSQLERDMSLFQGQMDDFIRQDVGRANELLKEIADINGKIAVHTIPGSNNPNALLDKRDTMVRELAGILDIQTTDKGNGEFLVMTTAGHTLVDGKSFFELKFESPEAFKSLAAGSTYTGPQNIRFNGTSDREYHIEVLTGGSTDNGATYRVSLDGGITWLRDDNGVQRIFTAQQQASKETVEDLEIWFDPGTLATGDRFTIVPKSGLYWYENTSSKMNITPQIHFTGEDNRRRITGGSLAGYFNYRDHHIGNFREKLGEIASTMSWEVNRIHSQGAGLEKLGHVHGTYGVTNMTNPLNNPSAGLHYGDKLQQGNITIWVYNTAGVPTAQQLTFTGGGSPPNFDPSVHTLQDVEAAFDALAGITADSIDNRLRISATPGNTFAFGADSTGLLAALGINTFFDGTGAHDFRLNQHVYNNYEFINAGHVNGAGEINTGDNETAKAIAALQYEKVKFSTSYQGKAEQTLQYFYGSLVGDVGAASSNATFNFNYTKALANDLQNRQEEIAGVNLDEEMSSLIRFQHSYSAAAKLISTADQMFQTILAMK